MIKHKLLSLFVALIATTSLWASNTITYTASAKLSETTSSSGSGLHTNAFNVSISSHTFSNGTGTIICKGEITTIGERAFYSCEGLTSVTIPNSVTTIGDRAFYNCMGLILVTINSNAICSKTYSSYSTIGNIFGSQVKEYIIGDSVTTIGSFAFYNCKGLTSVTIPNSVTTIGDYAFDGCSGLTSPVYNANCFAYMPPSYQGAYTIPNGIKQIAGSVFYNCKGLTSVTIPNSVTTIGSFAFDNCSGLTSVTIGNSVTTIGNSAFRDCSGLTSVAIPNSVTTIGDQAFYNVNNIIYYGTATGSPWGAKCVNGYVDGYLVYSDATKTKLCGCSSAVTGEIVIPNSVTTIGDRAFYNCSGLTSPVYNANCFAYMPPSYQGAYTIPNGIKQIAGGAFSRCSGLTSVTIPNSVTTIGDYAFYYCTALTSVTIPNSVTTIGYFAFYYCTALTSVTIGNSVRVIGASAFEYCSGLTKTNYTGTIADWCKISFVGSYNGCFSNPIHYSHNFFIYNVEVKDLVIPEGVKSIGYHAFDCCSGLTSVTIPKSITSIGSEAFYSCTNLKTVTNFSPLVFHKGSTEYGYVAYYADVVYNYTRLGDFILTSDNTLIEYVGKGGNISIPSGVSSIDAYVFANNSTITSVTIPATIRAIGNSAFKDCYNIRSITCYVQVPPSLGTNVFNGLSQYAKVYVLKSSLEDYQFALGWRDLNLFPIGAEEHPIVSDQVSVMPSTDNVILTWPANDNAAEYKLVITKDGIVFCTLTFNAQGQLTGIAFAPNRAGSRMLDAAVMTSNGWQFTVTGLNPGTAYNYSVTATDASRQTLAEYKGNFSTTGGTGFESVHGSQCTMHKYFHNGNLIIERNGVKYTATGQKVR